MGVELGCDQISMAQKLLYGSQVGAVFKQMCSKTVPEGLGGNGFSQVGFS